MYVAAAARAKQHSAQLLLMLHASGLSFSGSERERGLNAKRERGLNDNEGPMPFRIRPQFFISSRTVVHNIVDD